MLIYILYCQFPFGQFLRGAWQVRTDGKADFRLQGIQNFYEPNNKQGHPCQENSWLFKPILMNSGQGNERKNYKAVSSHTCQNGNYQKIKVLGRLRAVDIGIVENGTGCWGGH